MTPESRVVYVSCGSRCQVGVVMGSQGELQAYSLMMPYAPGRSFMWVSDSILDAIKQANILSDGGFVDTSDRVIYV